MNSSTILRPPLSTRRLARALPDLEIRLFSLLAPFIQALELVHPVLLPVRDGDERTERLGVRKGGFVERGGGGESIGAGPGRDDVLERERAAAGGATEAGEEGEEEVAVELEDV
jgi:hypothetical protein